MKQTTYKQISKEGKLSYKIEVTTHDDKFIIPVVDVRDGDETRKEIQLGLKLSRGNKSKFLTESFSGIGRSYSVSPKLYRK